MKNEEKMILIIDKPNECSECPCFYDYLRCQAEADAKVYGEKRPYNCPLKPLPQKKEIDEHHEMMQWDDDCDMAYSCGYNCCLEDILHGEEE